MSYASCFYSAAILVVCNGLDGQMLNRRLHSRNEFQDLQTWLYQSEMCERMTDKCGFCDEVGRLSQCMSSSMM